MLYTNSLLLICILSLGLLWFRIAETATFGIDVYEGDGCLGNITHSYNNISSLTCFVMNYPTIGNALFGGNYNTSDVLLAFYSGDTSCVTSTSDYVSFNGASLCSEGLIETYKIRDFVPTYTCIQNATQWSSWSSTCGDSYRTRTVFANISDPARTPCPATLLSTEEQFFICNQDLIPLSVAESICDDSLMVCRLRPDSVHPFNTLDYFLSGKSSFTDGYVLDVYDRTINCSLNPLIECVPTVYEISTIMVPYNNITIRSAFSKSKIKFRVSTPKESLCNALIFIGNNVMIQNLYIEISASCSTLIPHSLNLVTSVAGIRFMGKGLKVINTTIVGAVVGIYISQTTALVSDTDVGEIIIENPRILNTSALNSIGGVFEDCWLIHFAPIDNCFLQASSFMDYNNTDCVVSILPTPGIKVVSDFRTFYINPWLFYVGESLDSLSISLGSNSNETEDRILLICFYISIAFASLLSFCAVVRMFGVESSQSNSISKQTKTD